MNLKQKTTSGLLWSGTSQGVRQILQFVITAILARLLTPDDFGVVGMAAVFTGFISVFNEMGWGASLIQKQDLTNRHISTVFWINIIVGIIMTIVTICISPLVALFYHKEILKPIVAVLGLNFFIGSFALVQNALLTKNMRFKKLTFVEICSLCLTGVFGITLAIKGFGVWSLVYTSLLGSLINTILLWICSSWRPSFVFDWSKFKELFGFSTNLFAFQIVNYFARNLDYLLIGKFLGAASLGYYTLAYKLMMYPLQNISQVICRVLFPAFSAIQSDKQRVKDTYLKVIQSISMITFPMMLGLFVIAPELISLVYGNKWEPVVFLIQVLCFTGMLQSVGTTVGTIFMSQGRADMMLKWGLFAVPMIVLAIFIGVKWGINGVAIAYTTVSVFLWLLSHMYANRLINLKLKNFLFALKPPAIVTVSMLVCLMGYRYLQNTMLHISNLSFLISCIILGIIIYISACKMAKLRSFDDGIEIISSVATPYYEKITVRYRNILKHFSR